MSRGPHIGDIEKEIQDRSDNKDPGLKIKGLDKKYVTTYEGYKVFEVDSEWIRNNLDVIFGSGGHGRVHTFIPQDEVWIAKGYNADYQARCIIHECHEHGKMKDLPYYHAHQSSQKEEFMRPEDQVKLKEAILNARKSNHGISDLKKR